MFARTMAVRPKVGEGSLHALMANNGNDALPSSRKMAVAVAIATKGACFGLAGVVLFERVLCRVSKSWSVGVVMYIPLPLPAQKSAVDIHECKGSYRGSDDSPVHLFHGKQTRSTIHGRVAHGHVHTSHIHVHICLARRLRFPDIQGVLVQSRNRPAGSAMLCQAFLRC